MKRTHVTPWLATHLLLVVAGLVVIYPLLWVLKMALSPFESFAMGLSPWPTTFSLENFRRLLTATDIAGRLVFWRQLLASVSVAAASTLGALTVATPAAYALVRLRFAGREGFSKSLLLTQMFPNVVVAIPLYLLLDALGLVGTLSGLALIYASTALPFTVIMLVGYFETLPRELEEAARVDGASDWVVLTRVVLPIARPGLAVAALFAFMTAWNEFILAATFLSNETRLTLPVALQRHVGDFSTDYGLFAAGAVLVTLPVAAVFLSLERHLVSGLTSGAVRG